MSKIINEKYIEDTVSKKEFLGTSGKLTMFFKKRVKWKDSTGLEDFDSACRFIFTTNSTGELEKKSLEVKKWKNFSPCHFEVYCEGAGRRKLGEKIRYDIISVFFTHLAFSKNGKKLENVRKIVENIILNKIKNKEDLIKSVLLTPKDLKEIFYFPKGNIDHIDICYGQTFSKRNYSSKPEKNFYQFGKDERIYYCGSGSYPCGSVAGTPGYMCAIQLIKRVKNK